MRVRTVTRIRSSCCLVLSFRVLKRGKLWRRSCAIDEDEGDPGFEVAAMVVDRDRGDLIDWGRELACVFFKVWGFPWKIGWIFSGKCGGRGKMETLV